MTWYLAAYAMFWAVLFGYLLGVSGRQQRLVERAEELTRRLAERGTSGREGQSESGRATEGEA